MTSTSASTAIFSSSAAFPLCCWNCGALLGLIDSRSALCGRCGTVSLKQDEVWHALSPRLAQAFEHFIEDYESIRLAEARGSSDPAYYLALPYTDITGKLSSQWNIRASTYRYIETNILSRMTKRPMRILDLGAGNGWMSYRLSLLGHHPVAVDILTNNRDGLRAAGYYAAHLPVMFPRVQASLDHLPFPEAAFDLAIFNASFHYSENYTKTLAEALRCVRPGGTIIIADTPWYRHEASGLAMVEEKHAHFRSTYGFASDALASQEFFTPARLNHLASTLNLRWKTYKPFYGMQWALRPLRAKLQGRRTPSQFRIFTAEVPA